MCGDARETPSFIFATNNRVSARLTERARRNGVKLSRCIESQDRVYPDAGARSREVFGDRTRSERTRGAHREHTRYSCPETRARARARAVRTPRPQTLMRIAGSSVTNSGAGCLVRKIPADATRPHVSRNSIAPVAPHAFTSRRIAYHFLSSGPSRARLFIAPGARDSSRTRPVYLPRRISFR